MSFSFFVLFKQDKIPLPLFGVRIPTHTQFLKSMLIGFIQLALLVLLALPNYPLTKLHPIFFMRIYHVAMTFSLLKLLE